MARLRKSRKFMGGHRAAPQCGTTAEGAGYFSLEPGRLFPNPAPLEVEMGSGKGDFILERARQFPQRNFLAIELAGSVFQWLATRVMRSGLSNLRAVRADARPTVNLMLPPASVRVFHIYFPDPWPKSRHSKHRLFSPSLIGGLARCLEPGGRIYVATDVEPYFEHIAALFAQHGFQLRQESAPGAETTNFGRRFARAGKPVRSGTFHPCGQAAAVNNSAVHTPVDM